MENGEVKGAFSPLGSYTAAHSRKQGVFKMGAIAICPARDAGVWFSGSFYGADLKRARSNAPCVTASPSALTLTINRHLNERQLIEMAVFYTRLCFALARIASAIRKRGKKQGISAAPLFFGKTLPAVSPTRLAAGRNFPYTATNSCIFAAPGGTTFPNFYRKGVFP